MSFKLKPESVRYPYFILFVIFNKNIGAWHAGGMKEFVNSKHITGAKMYQSYDYAEKVVKNICGKQDINNFVIIRYVATATEAIGQENEISQ